MEGDHPLINRILKILQERVIREVGVVVGLVVHQMDHREGEDLLSAEEAPGQVDLLVVVGQIQILITRASLRVMNKNLFSFLTP